MGVDDREHLNLDPFIVEMRIYYDEPLECTEEQWPRLKQILDGIWKRHIEARDTNDRTRMLDGTMAQYGRLKAIHEEHSSGQGNDAVSEPAIRPEPDQDQARAGEPEVHRPPTGDAAPE